MLLKVVDEFTGLGFVFLLCFVIYVLTIVMRFCGMYALLFIIVDTICQPRIIVVLLFLLLFVSCVVETICRIYRSGLRVSFLLCDFARLTL